MQTIGSSEGGKIVSMTDEEHDEFRRFEDIVNGMGPDPFWEERSPLGLHSDLGPAFTALRAFADAKFRVREMQGALDRLHAILEIPEEVEVEPVEMEESPR